MRNQNIELEVGSENTVWYLCGENIEKVEVLKNVDVISESTQITSKEDVEYQPWSNSKMKVFTYELLDSGVSNLDGYTLVFKVYYRDGIAKDMFVI